MKVADLRSRCGGYFGMVSGTTLGWNVRKTGFKGFKPKYIQPLIDRGWGKVTLHRPHGDNSAATGEPMNEDAWPKRTEPMTGDLDEMLADLLTESPTFVVNAYMGSAWTPSLGYMLEDGDFRSWVATKLESVEKIINAPNCDITYDHSATLRPGYIKPHFPDRSWELGWKWIELVRNWKSMQGRDVYVEACIDVNSPHQTDANFACRTMRVNSGPATETLQRSEWLRSRPTNDIAYPGYKDSNWAMPSQKLTGKKLDMNVWLGREPLQQYASCIVDVLARGAEWEFAAALWYLPNTIDEVHAAVVNRASQLAADYGRFYLS